MCTLRKMYINSNKKSDAEKVACFFIFQVLCDDIVDHTLFNDGQEKRHDSNWQNRFYDPTRGKGTKDLSALQRNTSPVLQFPEF